MNEIKSFEEVIGHPCLSMKDVNKLIDKRNRISLQFIVVTYLGFTIFVLAGVHPAISITYFFTSSAVHWFFYNIFDKKIKTSIDDLETYSQYLIKKKND